MALREERATSEFSRCSAKRRLYSPVAGQSSRDFARSANARVSPQAAAEAVDENLLVNRKILNSTTSAMRQKTASFSLIRNSFRVLKEGRERQRKNPPSAAV